MLLPRTRARRRRVRRCRCHGHSVANRRSPGSSYHRIDLCATDPTELSGASSPGASSLKRFACQFDPGSKNGRVLVLLFDRNGDSEFKEMSRLDVLRMTQQAAAPSEEEPEEVGEATDITPPMPLRRLGSVGAKGRRTSMHVTRGDGGGIDGPNYATVCDVQVGGGSCREEAEDAGGLDGYHFGVGDIAVLLASARARHSPNGKRVLSVE